MAASHKGARTGYAPGGGPGRIPMSADARRGYQTLEPLSLAALKDHLLDTTPEMAAIRQRAAEYVQDRLYGKPSQAVSVDLETEAEKLTKEEICAITRALFTNQPGAVDSGSEGGPTPDN